MDQTLQRNKFVGEWRKVTRLPCSERYPDIIHFGENGLYRARNETPGTFSTWDVGTYSVAAEHSLAISTANDAVVTYGTALSGKLLTFTDSAGCAFAYERTG